eukprot:Gregarina_sp_Poly_1__6766@NODE_364_length_9189_cov_605_028174_g300_i0_p4_GENE_NODE_364_length_9189_cov_605_028174_g300_i0NODE_364_length_9189_cov_605_028174_g300_i0_p4_ORF_typecomplete_len378_score59_25Integrin_beta/PF00362_18/1_6e02Integrin_beta/PF00362_18/9_2e15VWA/PF00092_28/0_006_NODE_364_length_9189_cov_605_028174_g300_i01521285
MRPLPLFFLTTYASASQSNGRDIDPFLYPSLEEVHGKLNLTRVNQIAASRRRRSRAFSLYDSRRGAHRSTEVCDFPMDVHILQDATGSFQPDFKVAAAQVIPNLAPLLYHHPGSTISLSMFRDKPINELGELEDYCMKPLISRTQDLAALSHFYDIEFASGGWDFAENQYGALIEVLQSPSKYPWMTNPDAEKLVILITDAPPHYAGDGGEATYSFLEPWTSWSEQRSEELCSKHYYPTPDEVASVVTTSDVHLGIIIVRPDEYNRKAWVDWEWFNGYIGQTSDYIAESRGQLDGWLQQILGFISTLRQDECGDVPPLPPIPPICKEPKDENCDECFTNVGCCDVKKMPKVLIGIHNPISETNLEIKFRSEGNSTSS